MYLGRNGGSLLNIDNYHDAWDVRLIITETLWYLRDLLVKGLAFLCRYDYDFFDILLVMQD